MRVADTIYVLVYTALAADVFSQRIDGWALSDAMCTEVLPLQFLNQATVNANETAGLIHHSDHETQFVSIVCNLRLAEHGITVCTRTAGDPHDNVLAENGNGSYKNELMHTRVWADDVEIEIVMFAWVN